MTHPNRTANRDLSDYLDLALRLANLFPALLDFETGEIGPELWDEAVGNPPPRLEAWEAAIHPEDRPARDASWAGCLAPVRSGDGKGAPAGPVGSKISTSAGWVACWPRTLASSSSLSIS